jgi:hypothetical protein
LIESVMKEAGNKFLEKEESEENEWDNNLAH